MLSKVSSMLRLPLRLGGPRELARWAFQAGALWGWEKGTREHEKGNDVKVATRCGKPCPFKAPPSSLFA